MTKKNKPLTRRDAVKQIIGDKAMTLTEICHACPSTLTYTDVKNAVNGMYTDGVLVSVGKKHEQIGAYNRLINIYQLNPDAEDFRQRPKGYKLLESPTLKPKQRREMILSKNPLFIMYGE